MSQGYQTWLLDILSDEFRGSKGFRVDYVPGWETRGARNATYFNPRGIMDHHTGPGSYNALLNYMAFNSSIAPLCNTATSRPYNGIVRITVVAAGRANHAGRGYANWIGRDNGNYRTLGRENQNAGRQSWPEQQLEAIRRCDAAELRYLGAGTSRMLDHKTYAPTRKVDRYNLDLNRERNYVKKLLTPKVEPVKPTPKPIDPWEEFWMDLSEEEKAFAKEFFGYAVKNVDQGDSLVRQFLAFNREERGRLKEFLDALDEMDSSPHGIGKGLPALWREAGARGWETDTDKFKENREYTADDLETATVSDEAQVEVDVEDSTTPDNE